MKLVVSSSELLKAILTVSKAIPAKTTEAILEDYLFDLKGSTLEITASDMEITLRTTVSVSSTEEEGRIAVPARQLTELLKELPDQPLTISTVSENSFQCAWATGASKLPYFNPDDYPQIATAADDAVTVTIPSEVLISGISSTLYAASDEDSRPAMCSIFFDIKPEGSTIVASDLQKLICYTAETMKSDAPVSFILNKKHAAVIKGILGKDASDVVITFDNKTAVFKFDNTTVICCLVVGKYPDYRTIIPQNNNNILKINRSQLLTAVRRIAVCSPKASSHIRFNLTAGAIELSAEDLGFEIAAHEKIACSYEGDDLTIGFKSTHVIEILTNLACEEIVMKFADKRRSVLVLPSEEEAASENVFGIVMPVMVR